MKQFKIYEIPGVKIGATNRWPKRVTEQGYQPEDCNILFETDDIFMASMAEQFHQIFLGYPVDKNLYQSQHILDPDKIEARSKAQSIAASRASAAIKADPVRNKSRSKNISKAQSFVTYQIDPETNTIIGVFPSSKIAAWLCGLTTSVGINKVKRGEGNTAGGFLWK